MPVNLSIKNVPDALAAKLRKRAARNHRSLQLELMAILNSAAGNPGVEPGNAGGLMDRLAALAGDNGIDTGKRLTPSTGARPQVVAQDSLGCDEAVARLNRFKLLAESCRNGRRLLHSSFTEKFFLPCQILESKSS